MGAYSPHFHSIIVRSALPTRRRFAAAWEGLWKGLNDLPLVGATDIDPELPQAAGRLVEDVQLGDPFTHFEFDGAGFELDLGAEAGSHVEASGRR